MRAQKPRIFVSYSQKDVAWAERLRVQLRAISRGAFEVWTDSQIEVGVDWRTRIEHEIYSSDFVIILLSPDYLASSFINSIELPRLLECTKRGNTSVIPIVVRPVQLDRHSPLWQWQFVNLPDRPLSSLDEDEVDRLFAQIATAIRDYAPELETREFSRGQQTPDLAQRLAFHLYTMMAARQPHQRDMPGRNEFQESRLLLACMPFSPDMDPIFEGIESAAKKVGLEAKRVKDMLGDYRAMDMTVDMLMSARLVVADLTHERPNVYFELGYARGLRKTVITIARQDTNVHFDVKDWTYIPYTDSRILERNLTERLEFEIERGK